MLNTKTSSKRPNINKIDEFERSLVSERTKAGLAAARARGRNGGRPRKMTATKIKMAVSQMKKKETVISDLASELGVSTSTLYSYVTPNGGLTELGKKVMEK